MLCPASTTSKGFKVCVNKRVDSLDHLFTGGLGSRIFCAGHSRGAQMAALCSAFVRSLAPEADVVSVMSGTSVRYPGLTGSVSPHLPIFEFLFLAAFMRYLTCTSSSVRPVEAVTLLENSPLLLPSLSFNVHCAPLHARTARALVQLYCAWLQLCMSIFLIVLVGQVLPLSHLYLSNLHSSPCVPATIEPLLLLGILLNRTFLDLSFKQGLDRIRILQEFWQVQYGSCCSCPANFHEGFNLWSISNASVSKGLS